MSLYDPICGRRITEFDYVGNATNGVVMVVPKKDNYWFAYSAWTSTSLAPKDLPESVQRKFVEQFQSRCAESLLAPSILKRDYEPVRVITPAGLFEERVLAFRKSSAARLVESDISEAAKVPEGSIVAKNKSDQIVQITPKIGRFTAYSAMPVDASAAKKKDIKLGHIYSRDEYAEGKLFADPVIDDFDIAIFLKKLDKVMDDLNLPPADWALVYSVAGGSVKGASGWMYHSPGSGPVSPVYLNRAPSSTATAKYAEWKSPRSPHTMVHEYAHVVWFGQMTSQQRAEVTTFYNLRVAKDPAKALADKTSPTEYGTTKVEEWWAEIVGYAMYGADKRISKEVYDFISDVLTGKVAPAAEKPSSKKQKAVIDTPAPKGEEPKKPAAADSSALAAINAKKDKIEAAIGKYKVEQRADGSVRVIPEKSPNDKKVLLDLLIAAGFYYDSAKHKARLSTGSSGGIVVFESHVHEAHLLEQIADQDSHVEPLEETPATRIDLYPNEAPAQRISAVAQVGVSDIGRARQKYRFDCGPAALRVVAEHYGIPASQDELIDLCGSTEDAGTPPDDLVFAARALGLQAETVKGMSTEALLDSLSQGVPVICPIQAWAASAKGVKDLEEGHYVVAIGFDGTNLIFEDPSMDQQGYIPLDEFETRWIDKQYGDPKPLRRLGIPVRYSRTTDESLDESSIPSLQKKLKELEQIGADADVTYTRSGTKRTGLFARGSTVLDQFTIKNTGKSAPATKPEAIEYWRAQLDLQLTPLRSQKEALQQLQDLARTHATLINQLHKQKKLEFVSIPVSEYNALGRHNSILLHKSPNYNQRQSSEYRLAMRDGRLVYIRKSNHWGRFFTNVYAGDPDSPPNSEPDQFGRTGSRSHEWSLLGGDEGSARSQAGYIFVLPDASESLDEEQLDETVQQVRKYLDGKHQVVDLGKIGLFRTYHVQVYPIDLNAAIPTKNMLRIHGNDVQKVLSKPVSRAEYDKQRVDAGTSVFWSVDIDGITKSVKEASDAILALGVPRRDEVLIVLDLSAKKNPITGGGVGGYAYRKTHAIEADANELKTPFGIELLVHEWAHKQFFQLPKHSTELVRNWYKANVKQAGESLFAQQVDKIDFGRLKVHAWDAFSSKWSSEAGTSLSGYAAVAKKAAKGSKTLDNDVLFDYFVSTGHTFAGIAREDFEAQLMLPEEGKDPYTVVPKNTPLRALRSDDDRSKCIVIVGDSAFNAVTLYTDILKDVMTVDFEATAKLSKQPLNDLQDRLRKLLDLEKDEAYLFYANAPTVRASLSVVLPRLLRLAKVGEVSKPSVDEDAGFNFHQFVSDWLSAVADDHQYFEPERTFNLLYDKHFDEQEFKAYIREQRSIPPSLSSPDARSMRDDLARIGVVPSAYAAANVDELWAELIAKSAVNPSKVSKVLKNLVRDVMQGKG